MSQQPFVAVDSTFDLPAVVRARQAANLLDGATVEGQAVASVIGSAVQPVSDLVRTAYEADFGTGALGAEWSVVRPDPSGMRVTGGALEIDTLPGDLEGASTNTAKNLPLVALPDGPWVAEARLSATLSGEGQRFGLIAYRDDNNYAAVTYRQRPSNTWRGFVLERNASIRQILDVDLTQQAGSALPAAPWFRLVSDGERVFAYDSADAGVTWRVIGRPAPADLFTHVGLYAVGPSVATVRVLSFTVVASPEAPVVAPIKEARPFMSRNSPQPGLPTDTLSTTLRNVLRNTDKYTLGTWIPSRYGSQGSAPYLDLGGIEEAEVRPPASAALGLAASLSTLAYDATVAGTSIANARAACIRLVRSVAKAHKANTPMGWGDGPQSAMWAGLAAHAGWLMWEHLTPTEQVQVRRMTVAEANFRARQDPEFWKDATGTVTSGRSGNSAAEENSWNSLVLQMASAMLPTHALRPRWIRRAIELLATSLSVPGDLTNETLLHGQAVRDFMSGSNVNPDGTVINHGMIHPDYMATAASNLVAFLAFASAGRPGPRAALHNVPLVYSALTDLEFSSPPYAAPGGTMYVTGSDAIYYPEGTDWGTSRRMDKATVDAMVASFAADPAVAATAAGWAQVHADAALAMQARSSTGQTYVDGDDDNYSGREQWVAFNAAWAWLARWVKHNEMHRVSNLPPSEL